MIPKKYKKYKPEYLAKGKRSIVYTFKKGEYAIKIQKRDIAAKNRIKNEARFLKILNKHNIGPTLLDNNNNWICYKFVKGKAIKEFIKQTKNPSKILKQILKQCFTMDQLKINKLEMHKPTKHIYIYRNKAQMIDFERCYFTNNPKNTTQFLEYISRLKKEISSIKSKITIKDIKKYKQNQTKENFKKILNKI